MNTEKYILWLSRIDGLGSVKIKSLLEIFDNPKDIWYAPKKLLEEIQFLSEQNIQNIISSRNEDLLSSYIEELENEKISLITIRNEKYPALLKEIYDPPSVLYMLGELPEPSISKVSVIGSRRCSEYGLTVSYKLSKDLSEQGVVIVSGMAKGIDSSAHHGAIEGGGKTIAVLGCGVDICYPAENRVLREKIIKNGCILSEYPPKTKPIPAYFPMRNRIISGLSRATIVVEAAEKSGTLITVEQALEQGRDVYAVPGSVLSKLSKGTNALIKQGAALIENYKDVLELLGIEAKNKNIINKNIANINDNLAQDEKLVYDCISFEPITIEKIIIETNSQIQTVQYLLTMLELKGYIQKLSGSRYIRAL